MKFGPDDEDAYFAAREQLVDDFRAWTSHGESGEHAERLLDFKWMLGDGELLTWRAEDVEEFLVDWMPRQLTLLDDEVPDSVGEVIDFFTFLAETGRIGRQSDPMRRLVAITRELGADLPARMQDPANWGPTKSLVIAMAADGVELGDQRAMDAWLADFNAGPLHRREAILGPAPARDDDVERAVPLAPQPRPDPIAIAAIAAEAPILSKMLALSAYLGAGRALTKTNNLKLVDARALVELLATGDEMDRAIGNRTFTTRSAQQLPELDTIVRWALEARAARIVKGSMHGTASFRKLARDPVAALDRLADALFDVGPLLIHRPFTSPAFELMEITTDGAVVGMLTAAYERDRLDFEEVVRWVARHVASQVRSRWTSDVDRAEHWARRDLGVALRGLEDAGILVHGGHTDHDEGYGMTRRVGGSITLTAFGIATVQRLASSWGFDAPILETFGATAADDPVVVMRALQLQLDHGGPAGLIEAFDSLGPAGPELVVTGWKIDDPAVLPVLEAVGRHHLDKPTARAARKAVIQHRSWRANQA